MCMPFCLEQARVKRRAHRQISVICTDRIRAGAFSAAPTDGLSGLMRSIKRVGLLSPILVRPAADGYQLIAGARRLAACRALGMNEIECIVMPALDEECLLAALSENVCRAAAAPDVVQALRRALSSRHGYTDAEIDLLSGVADGRLNDAAADAGDSLADYEPDTGKAAVVHECKSYAADGRACKSAADTASEASAEQVSCGTHKSSAPPHRSAHGYIRDERLIVNAVSDVVEKLRRSGIDAQIDVSTIGSRVNVQVTFPRISGSSASISDAVEGEHRVEFSDFIGENPQSNPIEIENSVCCGLSLSQISRELFARPDSKSSFESSPSVCKSVSVNSIQVCRDESFNDLEYFPRRRSNNFAVENQIRTGNSDGNACAKCIISAVCRPQNTHENHDISGGAAAENPNVHADAGIAEESDGTPSGTHAQPAKSVTDVCSGKMSAASNSIAAYAQLFQDELALIQRRHIRT